MIKLEIELEPSFCNSWPNIVVEFNKKLIFKDEICENKKLCLDLQDALPSQNSLVIGMDNKSFGKNHVWDTISNNNMIVADKTLTINDCMLNDISIKDILLKNFFHIKRVDKQPSYFPDKIYSTGCMNYNGYFFLNFNLPLYNSLIDQKYKKEIDVSKSYFSNYTKVFHYEEEIELINKIEEKLESFDEKSYN
jgi:hypothetical protein